MEESSICRRRAIDERQATLVIASLVLKVHFGQLTIPNLNPIGKTPDDTMTGAKGRPKNLCYEVLIR